MMLTNHLARLLVFSIVLISFVSFIAGEKHEKHAKNEKQVQANSKVAKKGKKTDLTKYKKTGKLMKMANKPPMLPEPVQKITNKQLVTDKPMISNKVPTVKPQTDKLLKSSKPSAILDTYQLEILEPTAGTQLISNTTTTIEVSATPVNLNKTLRVKQSALTVTVRTSVICNDTEVWYVETPLGVPQSVLLAADLSGGCSLISNVTDDPQYLPSAPVPVIFLVPLYLLGPTDNVLIFGEPVNFYLQASDLAQINVTLRIACDNGVEAANVIPTNTNYEYNIPKIQYGLCEITTPVVPAGFVPIKPQAVEILPVIEFVEPQNGQVFLPGSSIVAKLVASSGQNPLVTVELACQNTTVASMTRMLESNFVFAPSPKIYGNCVLTTNTLAPFDNEDSVEIIMQSSLNIVSPFNGMPVAAGGYYPILVKGSAGDGLVTANITGTCAIGGNFNETVTLGTPKQVQMGSNFRGKCTITAVANAPYFSSATSTFVVLEPLNPDEEARIARSFLLAGRILSLTKPFDVEENA